MIDPAELDDAAIEQLLDGRIAPADAPVGWSAVAELLVEAGDDMLGPAPSPAFLDALVAAVHDGDDRHGALVVPITGATGRRVTRRTVGIAAAATILALGAGGGVAAAGGHLPDPVQAVVHDVVGVVGIDVPDREPPGHIEDPGNQRNENEGPGVSEHTPASEGTVPGQDDDDGPGHSEDAPAQQGDPGNSGDAPGQQDDGTPGNSDGDPATPGNDNVPSSVVPSTPTTPSTGPPDDTGPPGTTGTGEEHPGNDAAGSAGGAGAPGGGSGTTPPTGDTPAATAPGNGNGNGRG